MLYNPSRVVKRGGESPRVQERRYRREKSGLRETLDHILAGAISPHQNQAMGGFYTASPERLSHNSLSKLCVDDDNGRVSAKALQVDTAVIGYRGEMGRRKKNPPVKSV